jgi:hypothetical protein
MGNNHRSEFEEYFKRNLPNGMDCAVREPLKDDTDRVMRTYRIFNRKTRNHVASFNARQMPGCCGILCVYYLRPIGQPAIQTKVFSQFVSLIVKAAEQSEFGTVMFTQVIDSIGYNILKLIVDKTGKPASIHTFTNWKTKRRVSVFAIDTEAPIVKPIKKGFADE